MPTRAVFLTSAIRKAVENLIAGRMVPMHIKLSPGSKKPPKGPYILSDDASEVNGWSRDGFNVGRMVEGFVVVDFDEKEPAREFFRAHRAILSRIVETRKGAHFYFSGESQTRKFPQGDIKGNGYVLTPPSIVNGFHYRLVEDGILQPFPEELFPRIDTNTPLCIDSGADANKVIKDIRAYVGKITSISGKHGHDACFRVACVLRDAGLSEVDALGEMIEWNRECASPEWTVRDLTKKVKDAYKVKG